jgi:hypothetical protein
MGYPGGHRAPGKLAAVTGPRGKPRTCQRAPGSLARGCRYFFRTMVTADAVWVPVTLPAATLAASRTVPTAFTVTVMVTVMLAPGYKLSAVQVTVPPPLLAEPVVVHLPPLAVTELIRAPAGMVSVTVTPLAGCPPVLTAVSL